MRYSLLNFLVCPKCYTDLTVVTLTEIPCVTAIRGLSPCSRVSNAGARVGPLPVDHAKTPLFDALERHASPAAAPERNYEVAVERGLLVCGGCGAWYPVKGSLPELLPDHLRNWEVDAAWLAAVEAEIPSDLIALLRSFQPATHPDAGAHHKFAEITLPTKVPDIAAFFGPGYTSPFQFNWPEHTWHLIRNFAVAERLLELEPGHRVLDVGSGYSWTTEWMLRGGYEPIGIDICRGYLEVGLIRVGVNRPHLIVGDLEHLPIRYNSMHAVLGFEAFHHVPNRPAAMREFERVLIDGRPVVLVEPGAAHEHAPVAIEVMEKYGTIERGMELDDVVGYAEGTGLANCRQHHILRYEAPSTRPLNVNADTPSPVLANHVFTLRKNSGVSAGIQKRKTLRTRVARHLWSAYVRVARQQAAHSPAQEGDRSASR